MEKAMARAKRNAHRRGRTRFSHARRCHQGPAPCSSPSGGRRIAPADTADPWNDYEDVLPLEELDDEGASSDLLKSKSRGLDYEELLAQDPFYSYGELPVFSRGLDPFEDAFADIYSCDDQETPNTASFFSLDLEQLGEQLAKVSLAKRLFLDDETLPSELFVAAGTDTGESRKPVIDEQDFENVGPIKGLLEEPLPSDQEPAEDVKGWLSEVLQDPEDGKPVIFSGTQESLVQRESSEVATDSVSKAAENELDELLTMLDKVRIEESSGIVPQENASNVHIGAQSSVMSQKNLESLFWSPPSPKADSVRKTSVMENIDKGKQQQPEHLPGTVDDDFDAWLDSLDS